ncbi:MAG TPA: hypothetical protein VFU01_04355, partial [Gemmatimonadaceae bacterium]|nr:hypothetical protein [Gemmatimonadaceae bacterium]
VVMAVGAVIVVVMRGDGLLAMQSGFGSETRHYFCLWDRRPRNRRWPQTAAKLQRQQRITDFTDLERRNGTDERQLRNAL